MVDVLIKIKYKQKNKDKLFQSTFTLIFLMIDENNFNDTSIVIDKT